MAPADIHLYLFIRTNFCTIVMQGKKMKGDKVLMAEIRFNKMPKTCSRIKTVALTYSIESAEQ